MLLRAAALRNSTSCARQEHLIMAIDFKAMMERRNAERKTVPRVPPRPAPRPRFNKKADMVLWSWLAGSDTKIPIVRVATTAQATSAVWDWMFERDSNGMHVRAQRVGVAIWRRARDRARAGFRTEPTVEAMNELYRAIEASGGMGV